MELPSNAYTWGERWADDLYTPRVFLGFDSETGDPIYEDDASELCCLLEDKDMYDLDVPF